MKVLLTPRFYVCLSQGIPVEAELGRLAGEEDGLSVAEKEAKMTDPDQVCCMKRVTSLSFFVSHHCYSC